MELNDFLHKAKSAGQVSIDWKVRRAGKGKLGNCVTLPVTWGLGPWALKRPVVCGLIRRRRGGSLGLWARSLGYLGFLFTPKEFGH